MHFVVIKSKILLIILAVVSLAALIAINFCGINYASVYFGYSERLVPVYSVDTEEKQVAISFDAAWGADKTEGILEILEEYDVGATFFLVGFWVDDYPEMAKKIANSKCEIGTHSNKHPDMAKLDAKSIQTELVTSIEKIQEVTGREVKLFRPPFGSYNNTLITQAQKQNLITIQWDVDTLDWKGLSGQEMLQRVEKKVKNGSIILMHNNSDNILEGLKLILEKLKNDGYKVTSVGDLVYHSDYKIDNNGVQHKI